MAGILGTIYGASGAPTPLATLAARFIAGPDALAQSLIQTRTLLYQDFWFNSQFTPQQIVAQLGTSAQAVFVADAALVQFLMAQAVVDGALQSPPLTAAQVEAAMAPLLPGLPAGYSVSFPGDGSAVLTYTAPA